MPPLVEFCPHHTSISLVPLIGNSMMGHSITSNHTTVVAECQLYLRGASYPLADLYNCTRYPQVILLGIITDRMHLWVNTISSNMTWEEYTVAYAYDITVT